MDDEPSSAFGRVIAELNRRRVFRVAVVYALVTWGLIEAADVIFPRLGLPDWTVTLLVAFTLLCFPVAIVLAWAYDLTPSGPRRTPTVDTAGADASSPSRPRPLPARTLVLAGIAVATALGGFGIHSYTKRPSNPPDRAGTTGAVDRSIAVLPFVNMSSDPEREYFSDGLTEELLNALAQVPALRVSARTSSFSFKGTNVPVDSIARALRVAHVLEGSVRSVDDRVRITAQLIEAESGYHLWSQTYDRDLTDIFAVQDEIATSIASAMQVELRTEPGDPLVKVATRRPDAHDSYLLGLYHWNRRGADHLNLALDYFAEAVDRDPDYAQAHSGLALTYGLLPNYDPSIRAASVVADARAAARRALELDPELAAAHTALAWIRFRFELDWVGAEDAFRRAIELNPGFATAYQWYGDLLSSLGRTEQAIRMNGRAVALDPLSPAIRSDLAFAFYMHDDRVAALESYREALRLAPDFSLAQNGLAEVLLATGNEEAGPAYRRWASLVGVDPALTDDLTRGVLDPSHRASALMALENGGLQRAMGPRQVAWFYDRLGETTAALDWLERAYNDRDIWLILSVRGTSWTHATRDHPRFNRLLTRMGVAG